MKKFINHVDHVAWVSRPENLDANVAELERLSGATFTRTHHEEMGLIVCMSWDSGLEVIAPTDAATAINRDLRQHLDRVGEGVYAVIFGVADLEAHKARLEAMGVPVGPLIGGVPNPLTDNRVLPRERRVKPVMNSWFVLGETDYEDDVITFEDI